MEKVQRCQCLTSGGTQCKRSGSMMEGDNPNFCWQHQQCKKEISGLISSPAQPKKPSTKKEEIKRESKGKGEKEEDVTADILLSDEPNKAKTLGIFAQNKILPTANTIRVAINAGEPEILAVLKTLKPFGLKFDQVWLETAIENGNVKLVEWFLQNKIYPKFKKLDSYLGAGLDIDTQLKMLSLLAKFKVYPTDKFFDELADYGDSRKEAKILDWYNAQV